MKNCLVLVVLNLAIFSAASAGPSVSAIGGGWYIRSSAGLNEGGAELSTASCPNSGWYKATVPSTVLGNLIADGLFKNVFRGRNLGNIPDSLFDKPWWYRTTFLLPRKSVGGNHVLLKFLGINYRADIWVNGRLAASADTVVGGFRQFTFDVTGLIRFGETNAIAVEVYRPGPGAVTLGFVDWNPRPADHDMGLWRPVEVKVCGDVSFSEPFVATKLDTATMKRARLTVSARLTNRGSSRFIGRLTGKIGSIEFSQPVTLSPGESREVVFDPGNYRQLIFDNPRLWWTHDLGKPNLYDLQLRLVSDGRVLDSSQVQFGIRQISEYMTSEGFRGFKLNGRRILIRGGGWADQIFLEQNKQRLEAQINYALNMNLNTLRLEGFWGEGDELYRLCDEKGILIMVGWSAQWEWEPFFGDTTDAHGGIRTAAQMDIAARSFHDQVVWLRNHPSIFVWLYGSDRTPRPRLERRYLSILATCDTTRPHLASAQEHVSTITGPTAVKMRGPYDYVPPVYWYADTSYGGAFGFNTETGPGPQVPRIGSLRKMLSPDSLWPINGQWYYHCSRGEFGNLNRYDSAIAGRLGKPTSLLDYERKAQYTSYEAMRAMYEAFGAMKFRSTGVIQWMYNTAWPKMWWQLFDYYLNPTGAFYGAQEACMPLHAAYDYANRKVYLINSTLKTVNGLRLDARVFDLTLAAKYRSEKTLDSPANSSVAAIDIPDPGSISGTYFLDLNLYNGDSLIDDNFYALSSKPDKPDWKGSTWYVTPDTSYADLSGLENLPEVRLSTHCVFARSHGMESVTATLHNSTDHLAFMVYLSIRRGMTGDALLPVYWDANYITLLPGETRTVSGTFETRELKGPPVLRVNGWNIKEDFITG